MPIPLDHITQRKLVIAKQLYQQAANQAEARHSVTNRIFAVIGFDLAVETLLKAVTGALDQTKQPSEKFNGLLDQCDSLLTGDGLPSLPYRALVLQLHSIRNDAQHKAKYPNEADVSDCRTYARDFCREVARYVWDISFDNLSLIEMIDDNQLKELLKASLTDIEQKNLKKAMTFAEAAFFWASRTIWDFLPSRASGIYEDEFRDSRDTIKKLNAIIKDTGDTALFYAVLVSTGVSLADYKRFKDKTVITHFVSEMTHTPEGNVNKTQVHIHWGDKVPDESDALWVHNFVVNSVLAVCRRDASCSGLMVHSRYESKIQNT